MIMRVRYTTDEGVLHQERRPLYTACSTMVGAPRSPGRSSYSTWALWLLPAPRTPWCTATSRTCG